LLKSSADRKLNDTKYQNSEFIIIFYQSIKVTLTAVSLLRDQQQQCRNQKANTGGANFFRERWGQNIEQKCLID